MNFPHLFRDSVYALDGGFVYAADNTGCAFNPKRLTPANGLNATPQFSIKTTIKSAKPF